MQKRERVLHFCVIPTALFLASSCTDESGREAGDAADDTTDCPAVVGVCLPCPDDSPHCVEPGADLVSKSAPVDSWFVVSKVQTDSGHEFYFLSHVMRLTVANLAVNSVTDATEGWYSAKEYDYLPSQVSISTTELSVITPDATLSGSLEEMRLTANLPEGRIDVSLVPQGPTLYNCGTGFCRVLNQETYEYALPSMNTSGALTLEGIEYQVSGVSWFDRQWVPTVDPAYLNRNYKWTWMNLNLDNGDLISLWDVIDGNEGTEAAFATILHPDGSQLDVPITPLAANATEYWTSPDTGQRYPTHLVVEIPCLDTRLDVVPTVREQEIVSAIDKKYEGASVVSGTYLGRPAQGYTYVEMVGKWE